MNRKPAHRSLGSSCRCSGTHRRRSAAFCWWAWPLGHAPKPEAADGPTSGSSRVRDGLDPVYATKRHAHQLTLSAAHTAGRPVLLRRGLRACRVTAGSARSGEPRKSDGNVNFVDGPTTRSAQLWCRVRVVQPYRSVLHCGQGRRRPRWRKRTNCGIWRGTSRAPSDSTAAATC